MNNGAEEEVVVETKEKSTETRLALLEKQFENQEKLIDAQAKLLVSEAVTSISTSLKADFGDLEGKLLTAIGDKAKEWDQKAEKWEASKKVWEEEQAPKVVDARVDLNLQERDRKKKEHMSRLWKTGLTWLKNGAVALLIIFALADLFSGNGTIKSFLTTIRLI